MNQTEVQGGSPDVASVLKYIAERENNLSKYSDKLRQSVQRIFNVFGDSQLCQVCGERPSYSLHGRYFDRRERQPYQEIPDAHPHGQPKLVTHYEYVGFWGNKQENIIYFEKNETFHEVKPKIEVSLSMRDEKPFFEEWAEEYASRTRAYRLVLLDHNLWIENRIVENATHTLMTADQVSRKVLMRLIKSGRLTAFIQDIADALQKESEEYKEVAEIAERMAQAISS